MAPPKSHDCLSEISHGKIKSLTIQPLSAPAKETPDPPCSTTTRDQNPRSRSQSLPPSRRPLEQIGLASADCQEQGTSSAHGLGNYGMTANAISREATQQDLVEWRKHFESIANPVQSSEASYGNLANLPLEVRRKIWRELITLHPSKRSDTEKSDSKIESHQSRLAILRTSKCLFAEVMQERDFLIGKTRVSIHLYACCSGGILTIPGITRRRAIDGTSIDRLGHVPWEKFSSIEISVNDGQLQLLSLIRRYELPVTDLMRRLKIGHHRGYTGAPPITINLKIHDLHSHAQNPCNYCRWAGTIFDGCAYQHLRLLLSPFHSIRTVLPVRINVGPMPLNGKGYELSWSQHFGAHGGIISSRESTWKDHTPDKTIQAASIALDFMGDRDARVQALLRLVWCNQWAPEAKQRLLWQSERVRVDVRQLYADWPCHYNN